MYCTLNLYAISWAEEMYFPLNLMLMLSLGGG